MNFIPTKISFGKQNVKRNITKKTCSVPQCKSFREPGISFHRIPPQVLNNKKELLKWKMVLRIKKPFAKNFVICSQHFNKDKILRPIPRGQRVKSKLLGSAFPTKYLPQPFTAKRLCSEKIKTRYRRLRQKNAIRLRNCQSVNSSEPGQWVIEFVDTYAAEVPHQSTSKRIQVSRQICTKGTQVNEEELRFNALPLNLNTDADLNTMTGIPTKKLLYKIVQCCQIIRPSEKANLQEYKIILTMFRIKHALSFPLIALLFNLPEKTARSYFADCVQLASKALEFSIYWQSKEENQASLPKCFRKFPNAVTVLGCIDVKTPVKCKTCPSLTCTHFEEAHTTQLLVGTSPTGLINFKSTVVAGKKSTYIRDLVHNLKSGDAIIVDSGFTDANSFSTAGVEVIRPQIIKSQVASSCVEKNRLIAAARLGVRKIILQIKSFKALSERVSSSNLPHLDNIITIVCAIANLSLPKSSHDKYSKLCI